MIYDYWGNASNQKSVLANLLKYAVYFIGLLRLILRIKQYNVLNPHGVMISGYTAILLKRLFHLPVVLHIHGGDLNLYSTSSNLYKNIYNKTISESDKIIVNSNDIKSKVLNLTGVEKNKVKVVSPGISYNIFFPMADDKIINQKDSYHIDPNKVVLLFAGNAIKRKGLDILITALESLTKEQLSKITLIICSEGPEIINARDRLNQIPNLKQSTLFIKKVQQYELNILYNIATLFIFPSREEPLGLVGLEALACGTPVVGSNVGGIPEYVNNENGYLFDPNNPKELSKIIGSITDDPEIIKSLIKNLDNRRSHHDISISAKQLKKIFYTLSNYN
jgi:glycosyltransferase involved in cell wall biosynthesis